MKLTVVERPQLDVDRIRPVDNSAWQPEERLQAVLAV